MKCPDWSSGPGQLAQPGDPPQDPLLFPTLSTDAQTSISHRRSRSHCEAHVACGQEQPALLALSTAPHVQTVGGHCGQEEAQAPCGGCSECFPRSVWGLGASASPGQKPQRPASLMLSSGLVFGAVPLQCTSRPVLGNGRRRRLQCEGGGAGHCVLVVPRRTLQCHFIVLSSKTLQLNRNALQLLNV